MDQWSLMFNQVNIKGQYTELSGVLPAALYTRFPVYPALFSCEEIVKVVYPALFSCEEIVKASNDGPVFPVYPALFSCEEIIKAGNHEPVVFEEIIIPSYIGIKG
ncbi:15381_t:CDS:2, partial [Funneliformis geosporum]